MAQKPVGTKPAAKTVVKQPAAPAGKPPARERPIWRTVLIAAVVLLVGFAAAWIYLQRLDKLRKQTAYSKPVEVSAAVKGYTMRLSFAVRITGADTEWADKNGAAIEAVMKEALGNAQPLQLAAPNGMKQFENKVRATANARLDTDKVQEVVITDFLYASEQ